MENTATWLELVNLSAMLSGSLVGFILGLLGSGGSVVAVPLLLYIVGMPSPHMAIGTSAFAVAMNAFSGLISHALKGNILWRCGITFSIAGIIGSYIGSSFGKSINGDLLLLIFSIVMIVIAYLMLNNKKKGADQKVKLTFDNAKTLAPKLIIAGLIVGLSAGFFGIGGGFLIVPALVFVLQVPIIQAIGTSLIAVTAFGLTTSINYSLSGLVDWNIATQFIIGGVVGSVFGTYAASKLANQKSTLNKIFAIFLILMAIYMIYNSLIALGYIA